MIPIYVLLSIILLVQILSVYVLRRTIQINSTKETSESMELNPPSEALLQAEIRRTIEFQLLSIRNGIARQIEDIHRFEMQFLPRKFLYSNDELIKTFTTEELILLDEFLTSYKDYLTEYWLNSKGELRTVFTNEADLKRASKQLVEKIDSLHSSIKFIEKE